MSRRRTATPTYAGLRLTAVLLITMLFLAAGCGTSGPTSTTATSATTSSSSSATTAPASPEVAALYERALELVGLMAAGSFEQVVESFDATMKQALPADALSQAWATLEKQVGAYQEEIAARDEASGEYRAVIVQAQFEQAPLDIRIVFDQEGLVAGLFFQPAQIAYESPSYVDPGSFTEQEIVVGSGEWELPGTLTLPNGDGPFPGVVLVHGSGPNDRDESIGPNKPFRDLAQGLASAGIAVLRYDKRTLHYADRYKDPAATESLTVNEETVDDAVAAAQATRALPSIEPTRVFVLGHSQGASMIPRIGAADADITGFILLAGAARPLEDLILEQTEYLLSLEANPAADDLDELEQLKGQVARVKSPELNLDTPAAELPLGIPAAYWLDLREYEPARLATELGRPLLILQGGRDYQVTEEDFTIWKTALDSSSHAEFLLYPSLNHLFIAGSGPSTPTEYLRAGHVDGSVVVDIAGWVNSVD